ncbi:MAG: dTMP kinase [Parcubacteria group bacterium Gr01-1014_72]|nr:MAG: dTMP kinase [Parcubacteria group bacterium Gr01-1014_72]
MGPKRASIFYALDRYEKSLEIREWLAQGRVVISNRYVSSNMGHQAGNIRDAKKRAAFLKWLIELEYGIFGIPKPDVTILLYVDPAAAQKFVDKKMARAYTKGRKRDMLEADIRHLQNAAEAFRAVAKKYRWTVIDCMRGEEVITIPEVEKLVYGAARKIL